MKNRFVSCTVPWSTGVWGLDLTHSDTDTVPECSVAFSGHLPGTARTNVMAWVEVRFDDATFVRASPHRDDEDLVEVTGYQIEARAGDYEANRARWLETGLHPNPGFYRASDSRWLDENRGAWSARNRRHPPIQTARHFVLDGRDGYVEVLASGYSWLAWHEGRPRSQDVDRGAPLMSGSWSAKPSSGAKPGG